MTSRRAVPSVALAAAVVAAALGHAPPAAAQPSDLAALFPSQAPIEVPVSGRLVRLELPAEVVGACRPDLSDLRIFDAAGNEVPFVVSSGAGEDREIVATTIAAAEVLEARRETEEREGAPALRRESYVLASPPAAPEQASWDLVLAVGAPDFVSRIEVRMDGTDDPAAPMAGGSVFRLREVGAEKLRLPLPASGDAQWRVELESEGARFLEPAFRYESRRRLEGAAELEAPLAMRSVAREDRATVVVLERPPGLVPARLRIASSTPFLKRTVAVWDDGAGARDEALGRGRIFRVETGLAREGEQAAGGTDAVEELEIALEAARGDALRVVIDDGDSPPLADLAFTAVLPRPALLFALAAPRAGGTGAGGGAPAEDGSGESGAAAAGPPAVATLRFGGGRAFRPRYDVAALPLGMPAAGTAASIAAILHDSRRLPRATLGAIAANPAYDPQPALAWARRPGIAIDPRLWSHRRSLDAKPSAEGLSRLRLGIADLGVARADLADLRILDQEGRQWAYLVERDATHQTLALAVEESRSRDGVSMWTLAPPAAPATAIELAVRTAVPYFDRPFEVEAELGDEKRTIASGRLVRAAGDPRPVLISFPATRFDVLELSIVDGDDAPLELAGVDARFPVPEVFFAAPEGRYALLVGHPEAEAPRYELERVRDVVLAVRAAPVEAGELEENTAFSAGARLASGEAWQRVLLWGALLVLVAFLAVLTLRLARSGPT